MKKLFTALVLLALLFCLTACSEGELKEFSCEEIIKAYEDEGCHVEYHDHNEENNGYVCRIIVYETKDTNSDLVEINLCLTEEAAKEAAEADKYNIAIWLVASVMGEHRWLKSGTYGSIAYSSYSSKMIQPFLELTK